MATENIQVLTKQNEVLQTEIELPLTVEEKQELQECEFRIEKAKELIENANLVIAQEFARIRAKKLYRETHKTLEDYVGDRFGYARTYAQNLAQWGDFINIANEALEAANSENGSAKINFSINTIKQMVVATNRLGKYLGLRESEFDILKPVINNSIRTFIESAPRAKNNVLPNLVPRIVIGFYESLNDSIQEMVVMVEGETVTVAEAIEKNLLNSNTREEIISQIAEQISGNSEAISLKANYENKTLKIKCDTEKNITSRWRSAELLAKEYLESLPDVFKVEDVSESNLGYDLEVTYKNSSKIYVEVKKVSSFNEPFKLTNNEFACANNYGENYCIALIIENPFEINFISNPAAELNPVKVVEKISWKFGDYANNLQEGI